MTRVNPRLVPAMVTLSEERGEARPIRQGLIGCSKSGQIEFNCLFLDCIPEVYVSYSII